MRTKPVRTGAGIKLFMLGLRSKRPAGLRHSPVMPAASNAAHSGYARLAVLRGNGAWDHVIVLSEIWAPYQSDGVRAGIIAPPVAGNVFYRFQESP